MPGNEERLNLRITGKNSSQQAFGSLRRSLDGIKRSLAAVTAGFAGFLGAAGLASAVRGIVSTNREFQSLKATLETFTGSAERASGAFKVLQEFAAQTPFDLNDLTGAFNRMLSVGLTPSIKALNAFGNVAAGSSKSIIQFVEAVADAAVGEFERLKEFGIKAAKEGDKVTFTFKGTSTTVGNTAREIEGFLTKLGETEFAGAMDRQAKTLNGTFSNLRDTFDKFAVRIGESGFNNALQSLAERMRVLVGGSNGLAEAIGRVLASGVQSLGSIFEGIARGIKLASDNSAILRNVFFTLLSIGISQRVIAIGVAFVKLAAAIRAAGAVTVAFHAISSKSLLVIAGMAVIISKATGQFENLQAAIQKVWDQTKQLIPTISEKLKSALQGAGVDLSALEANLTSFGNNASTSVEGLDEKLRLALQGMNNLPAAAEAASGGLAKVKDAATKTKDAVKSVAGSFASSFASSVQGVISKTQSVSDAFRSMAQSVLASLSRIATSQLISSIGAALGGGGQGGGGTSGFPSFAGFFAKGGNIPAGQFGIAGEDGPEPVLGPATVLPNSAMRGSGSTINQTVNIQSGISRLDRAWVMAQLERAKAEMRKGADRDRRIANRGRSDAAFAT